MAKNDRHPSATCSERIHTSSNEQGDEDADLTSLLEQTAQFGAGNREIIARIDASEVVVTYQYRMNFDIADVKIDDAPVRVEETKHEVVSKEVVDKFKPKITLKPVRDLFNDNVV